MARQAVGMEVNETCIRAVSVRRGRRGVVVESFAAVEHDGAVGANGVVDGERYLEAFEQALEKVGAQRKNVCIAAVSHDADVRELEFPVMPEKDLEHTIRFELSNVVRFSSGRDEELVFDYLPLPGDQQRGRRRLVAMSAPRQVVRGYLDPLYAAGIYPEILDMGAFSLPRVCPREGGVCYVHTGTGGAQVLIFEAAEFRVARQVSVDLSPLVELGRQRARGGGSGGAAVDGVAPDDPLVVKAFEELAVAVERTLDYHRARRRAAVVTELIEGLIVSGELGREPKFAREFGRRIGIPTTLADPILGPGDAHVFGAEAPLYAVAAGMGARGLEKL